VFRSLSSRLRAGIGSIILAFSVSSAVSMLGIAASARAVSGLIESNGAAIVSAAISRSLLVSASLALVATAIGVFAGFRIMRGLREPIARLDEAMERIASGDRAARLEDIGVAEFSLLESSFNDMAERLDEAEQGLVRSYEGQRKILDEIPVGFLTFGPDYRIEPEYSLATERIFGRSGLAGQPFPGLLFPSGGSGADELRRYLKQLFENTTADKDFLDEINPVREFVLSSDSGDRDIEIGFDRLREGGKVLDVLVTIEDRTEAIVAEQSLEEERRAHKRDADSIQAILSIGPGPLKDFFAETREMIAHIRENLGRLDEVANVNSCFRFLHSIKGSAGSFGIEAIATTAHEAEDIFAVLREAKRAPETRELVRINVLLGVMGDELGAFESLVANLKATLLRLEESDLRGEKRSELSEFSESLAAMVGQLQKSLAKPIDLVADIRVDELPHLRELRNVIIHLVRNAADHGLEDEYERLFQGKETRGTIKLAIRAVEGGGYVVEVEDDGQGINFDRIAARARESGSVAPEGPAPSKAQLLALLFQPGFSTKEKIDEISGRGVGLDLVRDIVKSLGGSIAVASARGKGTRFTVTIPA
jgi:signal transduction histidine kinase/HAMP domain-containing protein